MPRAQVRSVESQQVKRIIVRTGSGAGELGEIGAAIVIEDDQLAVQYEPLSRQSYQSGGYLWVTTADVMAVAGIEPSPFAISNREHAETVVLDFELPIVTVKCRPGPLYNLKWK